MSRTQIALQLREASGKLRSCVQAQDWTGASLADRELRYWLAEAGHLQPLSPALHERIQSASQTLRHSRLQLDEQARRLGEEMASLRQHQEGAQAYARHDLPLDPA